MKISMNISGNDSLFYDLSKTRIFKSSSAQINPPNVLFAKDHRAVKFTLSKEGKEEYRKYIQNKMRDSDSETGQVSDLSLDTILENIEVMKNHPINNITMIDSGLGHRCFDKPSDIFKAYTKLYDEIVRGYQDGTRENYIADADAEYGWRKATLEDELAFLDEDFGKCLIRYEEQEERNTVIRAAILKCAKQLEKSGHGYLEFVGKAKKLEREQTAPLPEDFVTQMRTAAKEFTKQYMKKFSQQGIVNVTKLLNDVTATHLDFLKKR